MNPRPTVVLLSAAACLLFVEAQSTSNDSDSAIPIWSETTKILAGSSNICDGTFADFNAVGRLNFQACSSQTADFFPLL